MLGAQEEATFGGGCFWCLEAVFELVRGVESVASGYAGGTVDNPTYAQVCSGQTGHAEVVRVIFYPEIVSYGELLEIFFSIHDPTTLNRQGADAGTQYRSLVICHSEAQRDIAGKFMATLKRSAIFDKPLQTQLLANSPFFPAEDLHQHYYATHANQAYCQMVIAPKLDRLRRLFSNKVRPDQ